MKRIFLVLTCCFVFCIGYDHKNNSFSPCVTTADEVTSANRVKYRFKIKTKTGGIVGNVLIEGRDLFNCISKLNKRYPGCEILEAKET